MITTEGLLEAYYDCRKRKRKTASAIVYEMDYEGKLIALRDRINERTYRPGKSMCFVVTRPRYREVFAAAFEDRIVHHWIALRLEPLFEQIFSPRTFNCRKGKGQLYGINMLREDVRQCSVNYTQDCYIMKLDLQGFFMSINKKMLAGMVDDFVVDKDKARLLAAVPYIRTLLQLYGLTLHPHKFYLQHYSKGVQFTGSVVKKDRVYTANHTITNAIMAVRRLNRAETVPEVLHAVDSINSYLGCFRHCNEYNTRRKVLQRMDSRVFKWVYIKGHYDVVAIKKKYKLRTRTLQRIRDGDY